jgi:hypothetical protein
LTRLAASAQAVLRRALDAVSQADPRAAHVALGSDDEIDHAQDEVILVAEARNLKHAAKLAR